MRDARAYLRQADRVIARLIDARPDFDPRSWLAECPPMDLYGALLFQVTGQQLSVKATRRIIARIQALFGGRRPAAGELLAVDPGELRTAGLSWRKIATLRDLASRVADGQLDLEALRGMPDDDIIAALTAISGSGRGPSRAPSSSPCTARTSCCPATWPCARPSRPCISSATCRLPTRSWPSPSRGAPTAAWPPATCSARLSTAALRGPDQRQE
ncbi:MAG: hypothetical protein ACLQI7_29110 [Streptosporangiaceae bacterium]